MIGYAGMVVARDSADLAPDQHPEGYRCSGDPECLHAVDRFGDSCPSCTFDFDAWGDR